MIVNGDFDDSTDPWWGSNVTLYLDDGRLCADVPGGTVNPWDAIVGQNDVVLADGDYVFSFTASATGAPDSGVVARSLVQLPVDPYTPYAEISALLEGEPTSFQQTFSGQPADTPLAVQFQLGGSPEPWTFCVDDVDVAKPRVELARNGDFEDGSDQWWTAGGLLTKTDTGELCTSVPAGGDPWTYIVGQDAIELKSDSDYEFSFFVRGNSLANVRALVQLNEDPWTPFIELNEQPSADGATFSATFPSELDTTNGAIQFQVGGASEDWEFCVDNVSLLTDAPRESYEADTGPSVRVNQWGYPTFGPKRGTLVTEAEESVPFAIETAEGELLFEGMTEPRGLDASSELSTHTFDFSGLHLAGTGLVAVSEGETSYPFSILDDPYESLRLDSLNFFYTQRSGIEIDGAIAGEAYARPAGHVSSPDGGDPNQGDVDVPCQPADDSEPIYGEPWTCDYTLDVTGGWYDAGDQGKYVVNGGISVYQLMSIFERNRWARSADQGALADGSLNVPESSNGAPDILDEARWELEFFLKMIVPEGEPLAGMAHHKIHDNQWTGLPLLPDQDDRPRWLHRPSTAATLNLAAAAAQGARLFAKYDRGFARRLLRAAETAWAAALENPALFAPAADGAFGGGPYQDDNVGDEFYWAAAELYLTTKKPEYRQAVLESPYHTGDIFTAAGFSWYSVAALGRIDLATVPNGLPGRKAVIDSVIAGADLYLEHQAANSFGQPYSTDDGGYVWGSNSQILNNIVVVAVAYDLTGESKYQRAALEGLDYILGRNALNHSFVTDYGTVNSHNQHSRWYANQLNPLLPNPPSGSISGGPNSYSGDWDPVMSRLFGEQGCAPQFCYVDDIGAWSTNELTINWNSALAWVASWAADQDDASPKHGRHPHTKPKRHAKPWLKPGKHAWHSHGPWRAGRHRPTRSVHR